MNEPIRLELNEEEWRVLMVDVDMELRRRDASIWNELSERVLWKLRRAKSEWEQNNIKERVEK